MSTVKVIVLAREPWFHAINSTDNANRTLCGIDRKVRKEWLDTETDYLSIYESEPQHSASRHICGICWWKYSH